MSGTVASFVSECAVMGPGSLASVKKMFPDDKIWPMNEYWDDRLMDNPYAEVVVPFAERQKQYATALYGECRSIEDFICKGMTAHAEVMRAELEFARSNKGQTWGFMNWMYSDCWPSGNWSVVDYYCEPKQVYYQMKRSFAPILLTFVQTSDFKIKLCVINDTCRELRGSVEYGVKDLNGRILWNRNVSIDTGKNDVFFAVIEEAFQEPNTYLYAKVILNGDEYKTETRRKAEEPYEKQYDFILNSMYILACNAYKELYGANLLNEKMLSTIHHTFYNTSKQLYRLSTNGEHYSQLGNSFALLIGCGDKALAERIIHDQSLIQVTLSMNTFYYDALLQTSQSYQTFIIDDIRKKYGNMLKQGATTFWETEKGWEDFDGAGSLCHGWSAIPVYYLSMLS